MSAVCLDDAAMPDYYVTMSLSIEGTVMFVTNSALQAPQ